VIGEMAGTIGRFQHLRELSLAGCPSLSARTLVGSLPNLRRFSWCDSEVEAGGFLNELCGM
jgi:hypothetical protein